MKRCPNCTHENAQTNMYCEECGTSLMAPPADFLFEQTHASVNEAYTAPGEHSTTTQEQLYYSSAPPPPVYQMSADVPPPPPPVFYAPVPEPNYSFPSSASDSAPPLRTRSTGAALFSSILYLIGAFCFVFGVAGFMLSSASSTLVGLVFIVLSIVALIVLVPLLILRKQLVLKWWVRVLIFVGLTIVSIASLIAIGAVNKASANDAPFGVVFVIYGFVTAIVAFW